MYDSDDNDGGFSKFLQINIHCLNKINSKIHLLCMAVTEVENSKILKIHSLKKQTIKFICCNVTSKWLSFESPMVICSLRACLI